MYFLHEKFLALTRNEVIEGRRYIGELMKEIERSNEEFIACYYDKYCAPAFPPSWMTLEVVSMGTLSKLSQHWTRMSLRVKALSKIWGSISSRF